METIKISMDYEPSTIVIEIKNTTDNEKKWVLFGTNVFLHEDNFGSDEGLKIENNGFYSYQSILQDFSSKILPIKLLRITTDEKDNFSQSISFNKINNSEQSSFVETISEYINPYQFQSNICENKCNIILDKEFYMTGTIKPNSKMILSFHPESLTESLQETDKCTLLTKKEHFLIKVRRNFVRKIQNFKLILKRNKYGK